MRTGTISLRAPLLALALFSSAPSKEADMDWDACTNGQGEVAIRGCTKVIARGSRETDHNRAVAFNNRGTFYEAAGDRDRAFADYNEAVRLDPKYARAYEYRGEIYDDNGDKRRAMADISEALRLDPNYARAYAHHGKLSEDMGDKDRALADFSQAVRLDPTYAWAYARRGSIYDDKGDKDRALADLNESLRLDPKYAWAYSIRGKVYDDKDRQEDAIRASALDWVIVRPTVLSDEPARHRVRALTDLSGIHGGKIARADVADFVVEQLTADTWLRRTPLITW